MCGYIFVNTAKYQYYLIDNAFCGKNYTREIKDYKKGGFATWFFRNNRYDVRLITNCPRGLQYCHFFKRLLLNL